MVLSTRQFNSFRMTILSCDHNQKVHQIISWCLHVHSKQEQYLVELSVFVAYRILSKTHRQDSYYESHVMKINGSNVKITLLNIYQLVQGILDHQKATVKVNVLVTVLHFILLFLKRSIVELLHRCHQQKSDRHHLQ